MAKLPLIVGFGGFNAAGRSSGHNAYKRMIFESLGPESRNQLVVSLASLMGKVQCNESYCTESGRALDESMMASLTAEVLQGTLVRRIESPLFDVDGVPVNKSCQLVASEDAPIRITLAARDMPENLPYGWTLVSEQGGQCQIEIWKPQEFTFTNKQVLPVQAAGQLPSGFNPASFYRSTHHPRGLQLSILAASDAINSLGIEWRDIAARVAPDEIGVYSSCVMSQLDQSGLGGMLQARLKGNRVTSKQLALGLSTMPADFVNAYVLGNLGATGGVTGACATFLYNLKAGVEDIRAGRRRVVIAGSAEAPILPEVIDGYAAMSALATDAELKRLDGSLEADYRRASRPFGENCGFTIAESGQYVVLMDDDLAMELGAQIHGAVPGVFVNADGYKKSISAPGPGNYITMAKAVSLARHLLGEQAVQRRSFIQAHGSSTPHNRVSESHIFDQVAAAFGIESWPVGAVKAYVGHSLGAAGGDQLISTLGAFNRGILPGIKTIQSVADDVHSDRLNISTRDTELGEAVDIGFLNSKGFGGNNATAAIFSPNVVEGWLQRKYSKATLSDYQNKRESSLERAGEYERGASSGQLNAIYRFGEGMVDEGTIRIDRERVSIPGLKDISLDLKEDFGQF